MIRTKKLGQIRHRLPRPQQSAKSCLIASPSLSTLISKLVLYLIFGTIIYLSIYPQLSVEPAEPEKEKVEALAERA